MKRFIITALFLILVILAFPYKSRAQDVIKKGETLNIERCIEIALIKNQGIAAATHTLNVNENRVGQAKANYYPQVNLSAGYKRLSSGGTAPKTSANSIDEYASSITLNQNIYDFGKTPAQVNIQELNLESSQSDLENVSEQVILNVKKAYYSILQAKRNRDVAIETVKQFQQHLEQAKGFFEVGTKPKFDVTKAEVDLSNAKLSLIKAENALRIAVANLNNAMGITDAPDYNIDDNLSFERYEMTFEDALTKAYKNRADIKSISTKTLAAENSVELSKKGFYPALTGNAAYNWSGESFPLDDSWNIGATLSFPLFSGYLTTYQVAESRANLDILKANQELLRQNVFLEVKQAYLNLKEAEERIPAAELTVKQAKENLDITKGRYDAGVGNPIEVTDAETVLTNAETANIQALYDYKISRASLEKAMGKR